MVVEGLECFQGFQEEGIINVLLDRYLSVLGESPK